MPGEQVFSIGGPISVRDYPTNAVAGDSGYYVKAELHYNWSALLRGLDTYIFTDWGAVFSTFPGIVELSSVRGGFSWTFAPSLTLEASYATPLKLAVSTQKHHEAYTRLTFRPLLMFPKVAAAQ